jgi:hypothetical protein
MRNLHPGLSDGRGLDGRTGTSERGRPMKPDVIVEIYDFPQQTACLGGG